MLGGRAPEMPNNWEPEIKPRPLAVLPVRSHTEALSIVSSHPRSLFASVWTEDGTLAHEVAASLNVSIHAYYQIRNNASLNFEASS
jgi:hypothetical protein